ncbi:MAG: hypothetical protein ACK55Z_08500, partial [bacterium]
CRGSGSRRRLDRRRRLRLVGRRHGAGGLHRQGAQVSAGRRLLLDPFLRSAGNLAGRRCPAIGDGPRVRGARAGARRRAAPRAVGDAGRRPAHDAPREDGRRGRRVRRPVSR